MCFDTQPQALWQVSIATIVITEYGIVRERLRSLDWSKYNHSQNGVIESNNGEENQDKL